MKTSVDPGQTLIIFRMSAKILNEALRERTFHPQKKCFSIFKSRMLNFYFIRFFSAYRIYPKYWDRITYSNPFIPSGIFYLNSLDRTFSKEGVSGYFSLSLY